MKLKNEQEIGFISFEYADQNQKNRPQIAWVLFDVKEAFKKGYTQAQQDLLASASESFEEWFNEHGLADAPMTDFQKNIIKEVKLKIWQAAKLSDAKEIDKLQKENQEMREALSHYVTGENYKMRSLGRLITPECAEKALGTNLSETPNSSKEEV